VQVARQGSKTSSNGRGSKRGSRSRSTPDIDDYSVVDPKKIPDGPDVLVDIPVVKVDEIDLEVEDLRAQVAVLAEVKSLVQVSVGADVRLDRVKLKIEGVEAQALLKARLGNVSAILERVLLSLDRNPELLESVGEAVEQVGGGARKTLEGAGEAVEDVGDQAGDAVGQVGEGTGKAAKQVGQGAGQAAKGVGQGAQQATGQLAGGGKG